MSEPELIDEPLEVSDPDDSPLPELPLLSLEPELIDDPLEVSDPDDSPLPELPLLSLEPEPELTDDPLDVSDPDDGEPLDVSELLEVQSQQTVTPCPSYSPSKSGGTGVPSQVFGLPGVGNAWPHSPASQTQRTPPHSQELELLDVSEVSELLGVSLDPLDVSDEPELPELLGVSLDPLESSDPDDSELPELGVSLEPLDGLEDSELPELGEPLLALELLTQSVAYLSTIHHRSCRLISETTSSIARDKPIGAAAKNSVSDRSLPVIVCLPTAFSNTASRNLNP